MVTDPKSLRAKELLALFNNNLEAAVAALRQQAGDGVLPKKRVPENVNPVLIEFQDVSKRYKLGRRHVDALNGVSFRIKQGEFVALTGPSGSGKSTLLQIMGGLDKPTAGSVTVNGHNIGKLSDRRLSLFRNQTVGFVFQFFYLQPFLRLQTNLEVPAMFARTKHQTRSEKARELAANVGLEERLRHYPKELSGGQMQRAAIARALLNNPKVLLADEPTGNLDSVNGRAIIDLFESVRRRFGTTIVVVTHDPKIAAHADREINLSDGEIA